MSKPTTSYLQGSHTNPDITSAAIRKDVIAEILGGENISRKRYEQRKFDIYRNRQADYVLERLRLELDEGTVKRMRKVLSINPCKRIVDQMGSIYMQEPDRTFSNTTDETMQDALEKAYQCNGVNPKFRVANRYYKLCDQACLYVVPKKGKIIARPMTPKDYDVIPDAEDPERAFCYVLSVFNKNLYGPQQANVKENDSRYTENLKTTKMISNDSDRNRKLERYVWWTDENHFTTDGNGDLVNDDDSSDTGIANPIGRLPFIDIAIEKDYQFFVQRGNNVAEFTIDLLTQLSDLAEISRLQGYSQAVIYSSKEPKDLTVGPNKVIWIQQDQDGQTSQPKFDFVSPNPDLKNSLEIINTQLKMFLSSNGLDATTVTGDTPAAKFNSGIDHLLANIDKFEASQEDTDLFRKVEVEYFNLYRLWNNIFQDVTGDKALDDDLQIGKLDDGIELGITFPEPQLIESKKDKEDSVIKRWENELLTTRDAVKELYGFDDDAADEYLQELADDKLANPRPALPTFGQPDAAGTAAQPGKAPPANGNQKPNDPNAPSAGGGNDPVESGAASTNDKQKNPKQQQAPKKGQPTIKGK